jgi:nitroreductase
MELYEAIEKRRTIRDFEARPIPPEVLERIISAGMKAPTNNHLRQWEFVVCTDPADKKRLVEPIPFVNNTGAIDKMLDSWGMTDTDQRYCYQEAVPRQHSMITNAAAVILPCFQVTNPLLEPKTQSDLNSFASIWCCIENMLLAAASEGIFGVTRIPFEGERQWFHTHLGVPENYEVACYLSLGYPGEFKSRIVQKTIRPADRIHTGRW